LIGILKSPDGAYERGTYDDNALSRNQVMVSFIVYADGEKVDNVTILKIKFA
jgi:hypothetical protein